MKRSKARRRASAAIATTLALGLMGALLPAAASAGAGGSESRVGHTVEKMTVPGSDKGELRAVDVHLWYPADHRGLADRPPAMYRSVLYGTELIPGRWDPLGWQVAAELAREDAPIDRSGKPFPVIVFSHGSVNDPIDYAHTLERIAGAGFVVAAPSHVNNTQDDVRIDFINAQAGRQLLPCRDGLTGLCSRSPGANSSGLPRGMEDRVRDVRYVLDTLPDWLGDRADVDRAGVLGHSRGTVTALAAAGGSTLWGFPAESRLKAVMGLAIGGPAVNRGANTGNVTVPTLLVAGSRDANSLPGYSATEYGKLGSDAKAFVLIDGATHRSFDSTYCDQLQSAGAIAQRNAKAILDRDTVRLIMQSPTSGTAPQYCPYSTFEQPVDIVSLAATFTTLPLTRQTVPATGLDTDEVKDGVAELAGTFFGTVLERTGNDGAHFTRHLAPKWLEQHMDMVGHAEAVAGDDAICPPGQDVDCGE